MKHEHTYITYGPRAIIVVEVSYVNGKRNAMVNYDLSLMVDGLLTCTFHSWGGVWQRNRNSIVFFCMSLASR